MDNYSGVSISKIKHLAKVAENTNIHNLYNDTAIWDKVAVVEVKALCEYLFSREDVYTPKEGAFYFAASFIHEITHIQLTKRDNKDSKPKLQQRETAYNHVIENIYNKFETNQNTNFIYQWLSELYCDIVYYNSNKKGCDQKMTNTMQYYNTSKAIGQLNKLFATVARSVLSNDKEHFIKCLLIMGRNQKFVFPPLVKIFNENGICEEVQQLLWSYGSKSFYESYKEGILGTDTAHDWHAFILYMEYFLRINCLAKSPSLQCVLNDSLNGVNVYKESSPEATFVFLIRVFPTSQLLLQSLFSKLMNDITVDSMIKIYLYFHFIGIKLPAKDVYYHELISKYFDVFEKKTFFSVLDAILKFLMNPSEYKEKYNLSDQLFINLTDGCYKLASEIVNGVLEIVYHKGRDSKADDTKIERFEFFNDISKPNGKLDKMLNIMITSDGLGKLFTPLLHAFCINDYHNLGMDIVSKGLFIPQNVNDLKRYLALVVANQIIYPDVLVDAIRYTRKNFDKLMRDFGDNAINYRIQMLKNMVHLKKWHDNVKGTTNVKYLKMELLEVTCNVITVAFASASSIEDIVYDRKKDGSKVLNLETFNSLVNSLVGVANEFKTDMLIQIEQTYEWIKWMCKILTNVLLLIEDENTCVDITSAFDRLFSSFLLLLRDQTHNVKNAFYVSVVSDILVNSHRLFKTELYYETELKEVTKLDCCPEISEMANTDRETSTLEYLRTSDDLVVKKKLHHLVHGGQLTRTKPKYEEIWNNYGVLHRKNFFFDYFLQAILNFEPSIEVRRDVIRLLSEAVCGNLLPSLTLLWIDWDLEKPLADSHIKIYHNFRKFYWIEDFIIGLSDGEPGLLWHFIPVFRSIFANIMFKLESYPDKNMPITKMILNLIDELFVFFSLANLLPPHIEYIFEIFTVCTIHEVYLVMCDIWRMILKMVAIWNVTEVKDRYHEKKLPKPDVKDLSLNLLYIIQKYDTKIGKLLPILEDYKLISFHEDDIKIEEYRVRDYTPFSTYTEFIRVEKKKMN
uniref:INTS5_C domain-containing protein n=1 Tax=Parastrongyloides trichosuri TaxID=131310 RepID=A0A0N4ZPY6_PARTI